MTEKKGRSAYIPIVIITGLALACVAGAFILAPIYECPTCSGRGQTYIAAQGPGGIPCSSCNGKGRISVIKYNDIQAYYDEIRDPDRY